MYVGSNQAGIGSVDDAFSDTICKPVARHGGADLGAVSLDPISGGFRVPCAARSRPIAI
jgi:hypothetical protein